jgi:hypothetical protein
MWGTSSPEDKLTGDLGNVIEATSIGGRRSDFFYSKKIGAGQFGTFATKSATTGLMQCGKSRSLNHLVSEREQRRGHFEAERSAGLKVDHQLEFARLLDRQVGRFGAL